MKQKFLLSGAGIAVSLLASSGNHVYAAAITTTTNSTSTSHASIVVNGQTLFSNVPELVRNKTAWLPIGQVMDALRLMNHRVVYHNQTLLIDNLALQSQTLLSKPKVGTLNIACGPFVETNVPVKEISVGSKSQTYVPVWYVMRVLSQGSTANYSRWKSKQWTLKDTARSAPSLTEIKRVMASATESNASGPTGEHFTLMGKPISITDAAGDTVTAAIGARSPSADGYGQVVFFFHNHKFIGLDSNMEKTQIQSVKADSNQRFGFDITYANYASTDPLFNPSQPPVTVPFVWSGLTVNPVGKAAIPQGAMNHLHVKVDGNESTSSTTNSSTSEIAQSQLQSVKNAIAKVLPKGATLINRPGTNSPYLKVDLSGNGQGVYAATYRTNGIGLVVVGLKNGQWQTLYNHMSSGGRLQELNAGDVAGDGTQSIVFQSYIGDDANDVLILKLEKGKVTPVLQTIGAADIGDFNQDGKMEVALWSHDTGPVERIQMYAWNSAKQAYEKANNMDFPIYFSGSPYQYNKSVDSQHTKFATSHNMLDDMWAKTYLDMGDYGKAATIASMGLKYPPNYFPGTKVWTSIRQVATTGQQQVEAYFKLSSAMKKAVDGVILKYSNFYNGRYHELPMVTQASSGVVSVKVIGTFDDVPSGHYVTATKLTFKVNKQGLVSGSLTAQGPFGNTVWKG